MMRTCCPTSLPDKFQSMIANGANKEVESVAVEQRILKDLDASFMKPLTASPALKHLVIPVNAKAGVLYF